MTKAITATLLISFFMASCGQDKSKTETSHDDKTQTTHEQVVINTPDEALAELKSGNQRFVDGKMVNTNYHEQIEHTKSDQHPHSLILSCLDSRIPPEVIFDQGIGNVFVARVAGNVEDPNILGDLPPIK